MADCVFCRVVENGDELIIRNDEVAAFLDHRPVFAGHALIVPVIHVATLAELPPALMAPLLQMAQRLMAALHEVVGAEGTFVAINNIVSQSVPHLHLHVVPRRRKDGLRGFFWPRHPYADDDERRTMRDRLAQALQTDQRPR
ncbi:MAG: HIT domain-containing protein [Nitriliruptorales bacterium]|nr:HIT domain-containing protein [Nitriliruptorales bacterium]